MRKFVLGACFSRNLSHVAIILKQDAYLGQSGLHSVPGGEVLENERPEQAVSREFLEGTGVHIPFVRWLPIGIRSDFATFHADLFYTRTNDVYNCVTASTEDIIVAKVTELDNYEFFDIAKQVILNLATTFQHKV